MIPFERRQRILNLLRERPGLKVSEMARQLDVSEGTIRNDLTSLGKEGALIRVRGGAVPRESHRFLNPTFGERAQINADAKRRIARWAADLVEDGDSILLDASTTVFSMVPYLQSLHNLTVVTNGIEVGLALAQNPSNTVILVGGMIRPDGTSVVGHLGEKLLEELHMHAAFVSCSGFSVDVGLTEIDIQEVQLKRKMIRSAERVVALIDSSKFGKVDLSLFASLNQVSHIVTDSEVALAYVEQLQILGTTVTVCGENTVSSFVASKEENHH